MQVTQVMFNSHNLDLKTMHSGTAASASGEHITDCLVTSSQDALPLFLIHPPSHPSHSWPVHRAALAHAMPSTIS